MTPVTVFSLSTSVREVDHKDMAMRWELYPERKTVASENQRGIGQIGADPTPRPGRSTPEHMGDPSGYRGSRTC
jgi:hypothetical protein